MKHIISRLVAGTALVVGMGGSALADSVSLDLTGPDSVNVVNLDRSSISNIATSNRVNAYNINQQQANTGDVWVGHNTWAGGFAQSGSASNSNEGNNDVRISNNVAPTEHWNGGSSNANIDTTGPGSFNRITSNQSDSSNTNTFNNVNSANVNYQAANTGNVNAFGNTRVSGDTSSGNAYNENSGNNQVTIDNNVPSWSGNDAADNTASISDTGPDSFNVVRLSDISRHNVTTVNNVTAVNSSNQSASTGDVSVSHNTVAGGASSGDASNVNSGSNLVQLDN